MSSKYIASLAATFLLCSAHNGLAQIPNAGFENWTGGEPDGWATSNAPPTYVNVTESNIAHTGARAARGIVVAVGPMAIQPILQSGPEGEGFAHNQRSAVFTGYYQFFPTGGDRFGINVVLFHGGVNGTAVAVAAAALPTAVSTYTPFSVPFLYLTGDTPDTCVVQIQIIGPTTGNTWHVGSYFLLDDIALSGTVGIEDLGEALTRDFCLSQNYPNPFNPSTNIKYQIPNSSHVTLKVFDVLGREVATLVDELQGAGHKTVVFDASGFSSGVYLYRLEANGFISTRRMLLIK